MPVPPLPSATITPSLPSWQEISFNSLIFASIGDGFANSISMESIHPKLSIASTQYNPEPNPVKILSLPRLWPVIRKDIGKTPPLDCTFKLPSLVLKQDGFLMSTISVSKSQGLYKIFISVMN